MITKKKSPRPNTTSENRMGDQLYRVIARNFPNGAILIFDGDLRIVLAEGAGLADAGLSSEVMEGKTIWEVFPRETCDQIEPDYRVALDGKETTNEIPYAGKIYRTHTLPVFDDKGRVLFGMVMTQDITERKRAEEALRASEEKFRTLHEMSPVAIVLNRLDNGQFLESNAALWDMTGYNEEEFRSLTYWDITPIDYQEMEAKQLELLHTVGRYGPYEKEYIRKDGTRFPVLLSGVRIKDPSGMELIYSVIQDITELKIKEMALKKSEARYRAVVENQTEFIVRWAPDGMRTFVNEAYCRYFNLSPREALGNGFLPLIYENDRLKVLAKIKRLLSGEVNVETDIHRVINPDGSIGWQEWVDQAIYGEDGSIVEFQSVGRDITERKWAEERLRESELHLLASQRIARVGSWELNLTFQDDLNQNPLRWSDECYRVFGYEPGEIQATNAVFWARVHPEDRHKIEQAARQALDTRSVFQIEHRIVLTDGSERIIHERAELVMEPGTEKPLKFIGTSQDITESKRAEVTILQSEEQLRTFITNAPVAIAMLDRDLHYLAFSRRWVEDYHLQDTNLLGRHHYDVFPEIRKKKDWQQVHQRCLSGEVIRREKDPFLRLDGTVDWLKWEVKPWHHGSGEIGGIIMFTESITERMLAEEKLRESERRYKQLLESVTNYIYTVEIGNGHMVKTTHGHGCEAVTGYTPEEYAHNETLWFDMVHPDDRKAVEQAGETLHTGTQVPQLEHRIIHKNGSFRWVRNTYVLRHDANGVLVGYDGLISDITERKRAEEMSKESEMRLELALKGADLGLWDWNVQTDEVTYNERWAEMLGYTLAEIEPHIHTWEKLVHPEDMPQVMEVLNAHLKGKTPSYESEHRLLTKSGQWKWILDRGKVFERDQNGRPMRAAGTHLDITERRQLEEQLRQAQKMQVVGQLAGGVAHDFNNIMTAILGNAEFGLQELRPDQVGFDYFIDIKAAAEKASDLTSQLLSFGRRQMLKKKMVDLNEVVRDFIRMVRRILGENIFLKTHLSSQLASVFVDPGQIQQVLLNLCTNARDAMPKGGKLRVLILFYAK